MVEYKKPRWIDALVGHVILVNGYKARLKGYHLKPCRFNLEGNKELVLETSSGMVNTVDHKWEIPDDVKKTLRW